MNVWCCWVEQQGVHVSPAETWRPNSEGRPDRRHPAKALGQSGVWDAAVLRPYKGFALLTFWLRGR
jgi:hypothetical protein